MYRVPTALAPAVYIPGLLYEAIIRARNRLYSSALLAQNRLPRPVISVGNMTLGGTGKTPLVIHIAGLLSSLGLDPAILTRGHGRRKPGSLHILRPGEAIPSAALGIGDEPALIRRHAVSSWMGICKDRFTAGSRIARMHPGVIFLLDDGFQHRKLRRDLNIAVIDGSRPLAADRVFPRGTLREPIQGLRRSDIIVLNGPVGSAASAGLEAEIRRLGVSATIFHCTQSIQWLVPFERWRGLKGVPSGMEFQAKSTGLRSAYLVGALGNPERFRRDVEQIGIPLTGSSFFTDHHRLGLKDWRRCRDLAQKTGAASLIVTEKDAIKIDEPPDFPLLVAVQSTTIAEAEAFVTILKKTVEEFR